MRAHRITQVTGSMAPLALVLCLAGRAPADTIIAQTGFNDAAGIDTGSPYRLGLVNGQGSGEPGWARPWAEPLARGIVQNTVVFEGDQALQILPTSAGPGTSWNTRGALPGSPQRSVPRSSNRLF